jgi:hypothetical protein
VRTVTTLRLIAIVSEPDSEVSEVYEDLAVVRRFSMMDIIASFAMPCAMMASAS